jgi:hypothetical protein
MLLPALLPTVLLLIRTAATPLTIAIQTTTTSVQNFGLVIKHSITERHELLTLFEAIAAGTDLHSAQTLRVLADTYAEITAEQVHNLMLVMSELESIASDLPKLQPCDDAIVICSSSKDCDIASGAWVDCRVSILFITPQLALMCKAIDRVVYANNALHETNIVSLARFESIWRTELTTKAARLGRLRLEITNSDS